MDDFIEQFLQKLDLKLQRRHYLKNGKSTFTRKVKSPDKKNEVITLNFRLSRTPGSNDRFIGITASLYFPDVRKIEKMFIQDFMNSYPLIGGPAYTFYNEQSQDITIPLNPYLDQEHVLAKVNNQIEEGAFNLFQRYNTLKGLWDGINKQDQWLHKYHVHRDTRHTLTIICISLIVNGINFTKGWIENNFDLREIEKYSIFDKFEMIVGNPKINKLFVRKGE